MKELGPKDAYELMKGNPDYVYLDVRSVQEYEAGHPERAINIPLLHFTPGQGMSPNEDFPAVVAATLPKDAKILVGCKTGGRSARACTIMEEMGYADVANVQGGYAGITDNFGRMIHAGWSVLGLPVSTTSSETTSYEAIAARARENRD